MSDEKCCGACGYPIYATKESACDWCRRGADRIEALTKERDQWISHARNAIWADSEELKEAEAYAEELEGKLEKAVEALGKVGKTYLADDNRLIHSDRQIISIIDTTLAEIKGESHE